MGLETKWHVVKKQEVVSYYLLARFQHGQDRVQTTNNHRMTETKLRRCPYILLGPAQYWIGSENYSGKNIEPPGPQCCTGRKGIRDFIM